MKKILIVIYDMRIGGAQKSLLSFLQTLAADGRFEEYDVHVLPMNPTGAFLAQIPAGVHVDMPPNVLRWLGTRFSWEMLLKHFSLRGLLGELTWFICSKMRWLPRQLNIPQKLWYCWRHWIPECVDKYDVAISYIDGTANYYVADKVKANKKVLWLHNDYHKLGYSAAYDDSCYGKCDAIVTISEKCREVLYKALPQYGQKMHILENITAYPIVDALSQAGRSIEFSNKKCLKLLTVGRLHKQKGLDIAIKAAKRLMEAGVDFLWLVVGDGTERKQLQDLIDNYRLNDCFQLIGARENPYIYMRECDILVQSSRYEGKSIVLDEAKMLCKPIVATNYSTIKDTVEHGTSGWIVEMNDEALYQGIIRMAQDYELQSRIVGNLKRLPKGNEEELYRYLDVMF